MGLRGQPVGNWCWARELTAADFLPGGRVDPDAASLDPNDPNDVYHPPGPWAASYFYDGLGRLIRRSTPWGSAAPANDDATPRHEDYYYDGLRRVAMHVTKPTSGTQPIAGGGSGGSGGFGGATPIALASATDYLWGPGGIDEPIGFVTPAGKLRYLITDASGTPVALLSATGTVRAQYAWEPYGQVVAIDQLVGDNKLRLGLHGLFFDRIDLPPPAAQIAPDADGLYHARNRFYSPRLGRFLQRDVNASGLLILSSLAFAGDPLEPAADPFDPQAHYTDGLNLFAFTAADPVNRTDPLGLSLDDDVDAWMVDYVGDLMGVAATLGQARAGIASGVQAAIQYTLAAFVWDQLIWDLGESALIGLVTGGFFTRACFAEGTEVWMADGTTRPIECVRVGDALLTWPADAGPPCLTAGQEPWPAAAALDERLDTDNPATADRMLGESWWVLHLTATLEDGEQLEATLLRPGRWLRGQRGAGRGLVRLELPEMGIATWARLWAIEPADGPPGPGTVTGTFLRRAATIALDFEGADRPLTTTPSHPFWSLDRGDWVPAGRLAAGERVATECGARRLRRRAVGDTTVAVYNLEVAGTHSYFVSAQRLWVHNGCVPEYAQSRPGKFVSWLRRFGRPEVELSVRELEEITTVARRLGVSIRGPEVGGIRSGMWKGIWHIHVGRVHLRVPPGFIP